MLKQGGFLQGGVLYVVAGLGIALVISILSGVALYYRSESAVKDTKAALAQRDQLQQTLTESEETNETLRLAARILDQQLVDIRKREDTLKNEKRRLQQSLDELAKTLPQADQDCLARPLPDAVAERLLNDRADSPDKDRTPARPGVPAGPVR